MVCDYKEELSVQGKKCIVTGGAQDLSRGIAERFLGNGAEVILMDLQKERLEQAAEEYCGKGYKAHGVAGNLSRKAELDRVFDEATELLGGKPGIMISAAGVQRHYEPWEFPEEIWNLVINVDLNHVWLMCQRAIQVVRDENTVGKTINIGSMNSFFGGTTVPAYFATKGVVAQLSESIASDCADHSVCYNVIAPGYMDTEMCANMSQEHKDEYAKRVAAGRWGRPGDLKGPVLFLASSVSDYLNSTVIPVDGESLVKLQEADQTNLRVYNK